MPPLAHRQFLRRLWSVEGWDFASRYRGRMRLESGRELGLLCGLFTNGALVGISLADYLADYQCASSTWWDVSCGVDV